MSLRPRSTPTAQPPKTGRLNEVLAVGASRRNTPYRLLSTLGAKTAGVGQTVYVDVVVPQLGSDIIVVRDDLSEEDQKRLADILRRVMSGYAIEDEELKFLNTLG